MSQYFGNGIECESDANGFFKLNCLTSSCDQCKLLPMFTDVDFNKPEEVTYHQFVVDTYKYTNKKGEEKTGSRTVRKKFTEAFDIFKNTFDSKAELYLLHRFEIKQDQFIGESTLGYMFHMDYSEKISCTPKYEPQDAHFSGKQTLLHCSLIHEPNDTKLFYRYHISDDKIQDSVFTEHVTRDLLNQFRSAVDYPLIRIKTDNCSTHYCCKYVFESYLKLSSELDIPIILYYGVNGHGRGLVDAMSGFGVKSPLRRAIITDDFMFNTADELLIFLKSTFQDDQRKYYATISLELVEEKCKNKGDGITINGCLKARMISLFPNGEWQIKRYLCNCNSCVMGLFNT